MLSRLKGIETIADIFIDKAVESSLDMLSRLKGIETNFSDKIFFSLGKIPLDMLSRLKGIET